MANDTPNPRGPDEATRQLPAGELPSGWQLLGGQYEIKSLIASGGFGITYLAQDTLGRDVAVKECFPLGLAQRAAQTHTVSATSAGTSEHFETARAQFLREARMLARLRHPNVVHVQTLFEENGTAYMAMDFIHGRDLQEEIVAAGASMSPHRVLELARDLLGALKYVHSQSVLHRDIKPQNIRIDRFGMPMLIDFGAARAETQARSRMAGTFRVVTDGYSPHEFYVSGADQGPWSDLYALAATLYHVVTGAAPVAADERASAIATGKSDPYVPIADAYPDQDGRLLHLIDRALRMTPGDRPRDANAWLTALADAPTTMLATAPAPAPATGATAPSDTPAPKGRFLGGAVLGGLLAAAVGGGIWGAQPAWLSPGMDDMMAEMGRLESALAEAETALSTARGDLQSTETALAEAEQTLARLEGADGDMAATMAELDAARAARDAAAAEVADLRRSVETLAVTQAALEDARAARDAATQRAADLAEQTDTATARIAELEAELAEARGAATSLSADADAAAAEIERLEQALASERTRAAALAGVAAQLTSAEAELEQAASDIADLEARLATALDAGEVDTSLQQEMDRLEDALAESEAVRMRLLAELEAVGDSDANASEIDRLRARVTALEAENTALREALRLTEAALAETRGNAGMYLAEVATLNAPNGTLALLPRFSWDNATVGIVDSTGGIALFDRETGAYQAHLARGIPGEITRIGFSMGGGYAIATTASGTPNRLFDISERREILRFLPTTVTTANRAISRSESHFVYTRAGAGGQTDVVVVDLARTTPDAPAEQILTSVPASTSVRVTFAELRDQITVVTPSLVREFATDGRLLRTAGNQLGNFVAMSPMGQDRGLLVLRGDGTVTLYDNAMDQRELAEFPARGTYTSYRMSGDRLSFLRANANQWEIIDLDRREVRGSGTLDAGDPSLSVSADGTMLFMGATPGNNARLIDVATGGELHDFGAAEQGYFSFDGSHIAVGSPGETQARILRREGFAPEPLLGEEVIAPAIEPVIISQAPPPDTGVCSAMGAVDPSAGITPDFRGRSRLFPVQAGGEMNLSECWSVLPEPLLPLIEEAGRPLFVTPAPVFATNILATSRELVLDVSARSSCGGELVVQFGQTWRVAEPGSNNGPLRFVDDGDISQPMRVWLATADGATTCEALVELRLSEPSDTGIND